MSSLTNNELDAPPWLRVESTLMSTARLIRDAFDARLKPLDLNLTQASLLAYVAEFGATTQTRLADQLGTGRAAMGTVVDGLERRGLIERHPDPDDRRVWRVDVTDSRRVRLQQTLPASTRYSAANSVTALAAKNAKPSAGSSPGSKSISNPQSTHEDHMVPGTKWSSTQKERPHD